MPEPRFLDAGDSALVVEFGLEIDEAVNARVCALAEALHQNPVRGVVETVPTFRSLMVYYDPCVLSADKLTRKIRTLLPQLSAGRAAKRRVIEIPVLYGGEHGPDLDDVAAHAGMAPDEVVALHCAPEYLIYMLGFLPGFAYLGGLNERIAVPRLKAPRTRIEPGSVGIGGNQTGIYPLASPGGWRLIGRTPVKPYDPDRKPPILYSAGDFIRFVPIDEQRFAEIREQAARGAYRCAVHEEGV